MKKLLSLAFLTTLLHADQGIPDPSQPPTPEIQPAEYVPDPIPPSDPDMSDPGMADCAPAPTPTPPVEQVQTEPVICDPSDNYGSFILNEFKMGYFRFGDKAMRHIYDKGILDIQLTSSFCFWKPLYAYVAFEYISAHGRMLGDHKKTFVQIVPISLRIQYIQPITYDLKYYLTAGPRIYYFHQRNHSPGIPASVNKWGCGGFINTGFIYYLSEHITVDFFGEYSYKRMHFATDSKHVKGISVQIGGMTLGAGIGYFW